MSEEEKKAIEYLKRHILPYYGSKGRIEFMLNDIILNLIETQQKKISLLKDQLEYVKSEYEETIEQQQKEIEELKRYEEGYKLLSYSLDNYTSKDKIKAKIEECREILYSFEKELELKYNKDKFIHKESMNCLLGQISILQSLLEKE